MRKTIGMMAVVVIAGGVMSSASAQVEPGLYGIQSWASGVYKIDESTGAATFISSTASPSLVGASFLDGELYACDMFGGGGYYGTIDVLTGAYTGIHDQGGDVNWHGLASSDALGLTWAIGQGTGNSLISTDKGGSMTVIGPTGIDGRGMAYDDTHGILYATNNASGLYTVDISTGAARLIGDMGIARDLIGLAYDEVTQTLYANEGGTSMSLYTVDVTTGLATLVGANGVNNIDGLAWIPEPTSLCLLAIGGVFVLRRR